MNWARGVDVMSENETDSPLVFTSAAATKVASLIEEEGNPALNLRIYVQGGAVPASSTDLALMRIRPKVM